MINQVEKKNPKRRFKEFLGKENWNVHTLGTVLMSMYNGQTPSRSKGEYWNGKINWLTSGELNCGIVNDTFEKITELGLDSAKLKIIPKGILVIAITGLEASGTRGNCAILGCNTTLNQSCMALFPIRSLISSDFLFYWYLFIGDYYGIKYTQGTKQQSYNAKILNDLEILIPSLDEQNKISSFFSKLDSMIDFQKRKLDKLEATKKALLQEIFPEEGQDKPKRRFKGFTGAWEQCKFVDLLDPENGIRRGPFGSSLKKDSFVKKSDYVVYEQQNAIYDNYETRYFISREKYNELIRFNIQPGDFIMSGAGTIGRISMVPDGIKKGVFNQALIRFKVNKDSVDPLYFLKFMQSDMMQKQLTQANPGSAMTNLVPMDELKKWNIVIPSFEEQNRISTFIKQIDDVITLHQRKLDKLKNLKQAYLNEMFV